MSSASPTTRLGRLGDERLAALVGRGDAAAFEALYDRHHAALLAFCRHMLGNREDGEDALQQAFVRAHRALAQGRAPHKVRPWLFAIARNRCLTLIAARRDAAVPADGVEPSFDGLAGEVERRADLRELVGDLARLPDDQRGALVLAELGDFSHPEIARVIGCSPAKVKALVFQARTTLIADRDARRTPCDEIRTLLETARGAVLRRGSLRRHLRQCDPCAAYRVAIEGRRAGLAIVLPVAPTAGLKAAVLGGIGGGEAAAAAALGAAAGGAGAGGGAAAVGGIAVKTVAAKAALTIAIGAGAAGGGAAVHDVVRADGVAPKVERAAESVPAGGVPASIRDRATVVGPVRTTPAGDGATAVRSVRPTLAGDGATAARQVSGTAPRDRLRLPAAVRRARLRRAVVRRLRAADPATVRRARLRRAVARRLRTADPATVRRARLRRAVARLRAADPAAVRRARLRRAVVRRLRAADQAAPDTEPEAAPPERRRRRRADDSAPVPAPTATPAPAAVPEPVETTEPRRRRRPATTPTPPPAVEPTPTPTAEPTATPTATAEPTAEPTVDP